jgi:hypothetical protein
MSSHPDINLEDYLGNFSTQFKIFLKKRLDEYTARMIPPKEPQDVMDYDQ